MLNKPPIFNTLALYIITYWEQGTILSKFSCHLYYLALFMSLYVNPGFSVAFNYSGLSVSLLHCKDMNKYISYFITTIWKSLLLTPFKFSNCQVVCLEENRNVLLLWCIWCAFLMRPDYERKINFIKLILILVTSINYSVMSFIVSALCNLEPDGK